MLDLINGIKAAKEAGASDEQLVDAREYHRKAQWRLDFISAENSMGFHAAQESARILGAAAEFARRGQIKIARLGLTLPPDDARTRPRSRSRSRRR